MFRQENKLNKILGVDKFNEIENKEEIVRSNKKIYDNKKYMDIEIECKNNKIVKAHKKFLVKASKYFEKLLSNKYIENNRITFDFEEKIVETVIKHIYFGDIYDLFEDLTINEMIKAYNFCDFILYEDFKKELSDILNDKYQLTEDMKSIKIYNSEELKDIPESIDTITFDEDFDENIDGKINKNIIKIIFGQTFKSNNKRYIICQNY